MNINIRSVTLMDFDAAYYVECTSFPIDERASVSAFKDRIMAFPDTFLLAEIDNKIVGV